ncbi:hypothetical protein [Lentibacillus salinarum]|uniref:Spore coat protein YutH n=1 Tax=Lentibacillus salinarum TaxID=446820 RepID=A0ABW3ZSU3_9BACI
MRQFLAAYYGIQTRDKALWDGTEGFKDDSYVYFTISAGQNETIHMEQAALAFYLHGNQHPRITVPVPNNQGDWYTLYNDSHYMVLRAENRSFVQQGPYGERLASFHLTGTAYPYEPQTISSYGQWKGLWIDKLTAFEKKIEMEANAYPTHYYRLLKDSLPYLIGISENAIQYMQESESDPRFHDVDQGTVVFGRCHNQLQNHVLWMTDLAYDHPARDLAEYIRYLLLEKENPMHDIKTFLDDYQRVRPLSIFSWRLLYARLLYPIHLFDVIEQGFLTDHYESAYSNLSALLQLQPLYEKRLGLFFENAGIDCEEWQIPVLHWL